MDDAFYTGPLIHFFAPSNVKNYVLLPKNLYSKYARGKECF